MSAVRSLRVLSFNVYGGKFLDARVRHVKEEIQRLEPDIVCLQEMSDKLHQEFINDKDYFPKYTLCLTSLEALRRAGVTTAESLSEFIAHNGQLGIMCREDKFEAIEKELVMEGFYGDDGVLRVMFRHKLIPEHPHFYVYNCHFAGGTFNKPKSHVDKVVKVRREQFELLADNMETALLSAKEPTFAIASGDFNCDADKPKEYPETEVSLEKVLTGSSGVHCMDLWKFAPKGTNGATESASRNAFRDYLKPGQNREVRFDRIFLGQLTAKPYFDKFDIKLVGTEQVDTLDKVPLFPSDHFGVLTNMYYTDS